MLTPLDDSILFTFIDEVNHAGLFVDSTDSGIYLGTSHERSTKARWAKAIACGPQVTEVKPGDNIMIEKLMWTPGFPHDGVKIWRTVEKYVLAVQE